MSCSENRQSRHKIIFSYSVYRYPQNAGRVAIVCVTQNRPFLNHANSYNGLFCSGLFSVMTLLFVIVVFQCGSQSAEILPTGYTAFFSIHRPEMIIPHLESALSVLSRQSNFCKQDDFTKLSIKDSRMPNTYTRILKIILNINCV
jgi:hypothetical protein